MPIGAVLVGHEQADADAAREPGGARCKCRGLGRPTGRLASGRPAASAPCYPTTAPIVGRPDRRSRTRSPASTSTTRRSVFRPDTIEKVQAQIQAIRERTGAEIVVYSQVVGPCVDEATAEADAQALMDQWGVGRRGFDDGLVILYDLDTSAASTARSSSMPGPDIARRS